MREQTLEGEVIEEVHVDDNLPVVQPPQLLRPVVPPEEMAGLMREYQQTLQALLEPSDYQEAERGKRFVKKSGWRKLAKFYQLSLTIQSVEIDRDDDGMPLRATVIVRATAPTGQVQDGDGYCSAEESRFSRAGGRRKMENDLRATATTRAKNRAIADLVGMGEVSAEEVAAMGSSHEPEAPFPADKLKTEILMPLGSLIGPDTAAKVCEWVQERHGGQLPASVGVAMAAVAKAASRHECSPDRVAPGTEDAQ